MAVQFWINGAVFASFLPRLPELRDRIGVDTARLGLLLGLAVTGGLVGSALCGAIIDRAGTRTTMTSATIVMAAGLAGLGAATGPVAFLAALVTLAFLDVCVDVSMNVAGSRLSARRAVPVINRLHGLWSLGTLTGGAVATISAGAVSPTVHLLAASVVLVGAVAYVHRGLPPDHGPQPEPEPDTDDPVGRSGDHSHGTDPARGGRAADGGRGRARFRPGPAVSLFAVMGTLAIVVENVPAEWAALRMTDDLGTGPTLAGSAYVAVTAGMVAGRLLGDHATARVGERRLTQVAIAVSAAGTALATLTPWRLLSLAGFSVAGLGAAVIFPRLYDEAARAADRPGAVMGAMSAGIRVGGLATPVVVGALASTRTFSVGGAMAAAAGVAALAALAVRVRASAALPGATGSQPTALG